MPDTIMLGPIVELDGARLSIDKLRDLVEVRVEIGLNRVGWASVRLIDRSKDAVEGAWDIGAKLKIKLPGETDTVVFAGEVTAVAVDADERLRRTVTFTAHDLSHRLRRSTRARTFAQASVKQRFTEFATASTLAVDVASTSVSSSIAPWATQASSDLAALDELARLIGFDWWVNPSGPTLEVKPLTKGTAKALTYGEELREFSLRKSGDAPTEVQVTGWDNKEKQAVIGTATSASAGSNPTDLTASKLGDGKVQVTGLGRPLDQSDAEHLATAIIDRITSAAVVLRGVLTVPTALKPGEWVAVKGAGAVANGSYPVSSVEHVFRPGTPLTTRFTAGDRAPRSLADTLGGGADRPTPARATTGMLLGVVTNNKDEDGLGRVKVKLPVLGDSYESGWARIVVVGGGADRGNFFHPEVDDEVLVAFEGGDLSRPLVLGGLHNSSDKYLSSLSIDGGKVQQRTIVSRTGHVLTFDDSGKSSEGILLQLQDKAHLIKVTPDKITISSTDGKPIELTSGEASIKIDGSSNSITMTAPQKVSITSNDELALKGTQVKVNADATLEMAAEATAKLSAQAQTEVSGSAMLALKGGMVQVN